MYCISMHDYVQYVHGGERELTRPRPLMVLDVVTAHNEYVASFLLLFLIVNWWEPCMK